MFTGPTLMVLTGRGAFMPDPRIPAPVWIFLLTTALGKVGHRLENIPEEQQPQTAGDLGTFVAFRYNYNLTRVRVYVCHSRTDRRNDSGQVTADTFHRSSLMGAGTCIPAYISHVLSLLKSTLNSSDS